MQIEMTAGMPQTNIWRYLHMHPIKQHLNYNSEVGQRIYTVYFLISERFVVWIFKIFLDFYFFRL